MKQFKGTKGTWIAQYNGHYMEVDREEDFEDGKRLSISVMVFTVKDGVWVLDRTYEAEANYQLIAAAPELLSILSRIVDHDSKISDIKAGTGDIVSHAIKSEELHEEAKVIISKALGKKADDE